VSALNDLETLSLVSSMVTIYCGIFFMSDQPEVYRSTEDKVRDLDNGLRLQEPIKIFMFFIIVFSNLAFFLYWAYMMIFELRESMIKKAGKIYLTVFLCGS